MKITRQKTIGFVLTSPFVLNAFLLNHLHALADNYRITVCINTQESPVSPLLDARVELVHVPIARGINLLKDLYVLGWLIQFFLIRKFDAVHSLTPKGGLLGMLAAWLAGVTNRSHTFTGQVWANRQGFTKLLLKSMDRVLASCSNSLLADSESQAAFLAMEGICRRSEVRVLGGGSISGVDLNRFSSRVGRREHFRQEMGIPHDALVFLYLGRLHLEKGVDVLAQAFGRLAHEAQSAWVVFVGPDEGALAASLRSTCGTHCIVVGLTDKPEDYLDAADVLCLPSYREGFGTVVIEAASMGLPAIGSDIYGLSDAIVNGTTGMLVPAGNADALNRAMLQMCSSDFRERLGHAAQKRAHAEFSAEKITASWLNYYDVVFAKPAHEGQS